MAKLNYYDECWMLDERICPCDIHFLDFLATHGHRDRVIFHFGTGGHHVVGIRSHESGSENLVLGITASREEHDAYERLVIERPEIARTYKVLFGDIYQLEARLLPAFDIVTLFHVGEFHDEKNEAYGALGDEAMVRLLVGKLGPGGLLLFYQGSDRYDVAERVAERLTADGLIVFAGHHQSLEVFRRR